MQKFLSEKRTELESICRSFNVRRLSVFGSAAREDFDPETSDVDLLVEFQPDSKVNRFEDYFALHRELEKSYGRKVDLIEEGSIRNPHLLSAVKRDERCLYAA